MNTLPENWDLADKPPEGFDIEAVLAAAKAWSDEDQAAAEIELEARLKDPGSSDGVERRAEQRKQNAKIGETISQPNLPTILSISEMIERLVWVGGSGAVVDRVTGRTRKKEHIAAAFAASQYMPEDAKKAVPCIPVWLKSNDRKEVDALVWVPRAGEFCPVPENFNGHTKGFNTWRGLEMLEAPPDWQERAKIFIDHVKFLVPVEAECNRFLQWLAHIVQYPEVLPHTAYLLIAETHGIGRNLLASILVRVFRGHVAAGISIAELLEDKFNGRLSQKLLFIVDEMQEGSGSQRYQQENRMRAVLTQESRLINPKFGIQTVEKNCCRGLFFSNHEDAIPLDSHDRRIEVVGNPSVPKEATYYEKLYGLVDKPKFIGSVFRYLQVHDLATFKPGAHATMNAKKEAAIESTKSTLDQLMDEFRETCRGSLAFRSDIDFHVRESSSNRNHITNAIRKAGMFSTTRRITDERGIKQTIVIVDKGQWAVERVQGADITSLLQAVKMKMV